LPYEWPERTDGELAQIARDGMQGQGASVEAMRRLRVAMKSDTYSRRMLWLTIVLTVLTVVQVVAAIKAWIYLVSSFVACVAHGALATR